MKYPTVPIAPERLEDNIAVWAEMNELRAKYDGLSLGEGAPGYPPPQWLRDFMMQAIDTGFN